MPNPMSAAIIVVYYPNQKQWHYFSKILSQYIKVYIIDNTPIDLDLYKNNNNEIRIIRKKQNKGIANALNTGVEAAYRDGYERMFLFDQDTIVNKKFLDIMLERYDQHNSGIIGFFVPDFIDRNSNSRARYPLLKRWSFRHCKCRNLKDTLNTKYGALIAITSGMLISYEKYNKIGPFREDLFIDFVDNEYALRAACRGLLIHVCCDATISHSIGKRQQKRFLGVWIKPNHHHPVRRFFIARNGVKIGIEYKTMFPSFMVLYIIRMTHEVLSIVLYEKYKLQKIKMILFGIKEGLNGNMQNQISKNL